METEQPVKPLKLSNLAWFIIEQEKGHFPWISSDDCISIVNKETLEIEEYEYTEDNSQDTELMSIKFGHVNKLVAVLRRATKNPESTSIFIDKLDDFEYPSISFEVGGKIFCDFCFSESGKILVVAARSKGSTSLGIYSFIVDKLNDPANCLLTSYMTKTDFCEDLKFGKIPYQDIFYAVGTTRMMFINFDEAGKEF